MKSILCRYIGECLACSNITIQNIFMKFGQINSFYEVLSNWLSNLRADVV